ncbi:LamG-like jellyroll fold domain-containing protein [Winogradskyella schleiferi]|uniref:LamG-like jellyroll fold domain-containing protein n=1 Tax=Winogradskyella schleiferi TaxID=2686078 RepID=UPI0015BBF746|nr:LamG-like jellyroll fold domain-containing protein [Winogradskyella schleiferi]
MRALTNHAQRLYIFYGVFFLFTSFSFAQNFFNTTDASNRFDSSTTLDGKFQLYFDGIDDYVEDESLLSGLTEVSLMGWIKIDRTGLGNQILFGQDNFSFRIRGNRRLLIKANNTSLLHNITLPTSQWIHIGATYSDSSNSLKLYINGKEVNSTTIDGALVTDSTPFYLGRKHYGLDYWHFKGHMDEVRLFNKALTSDDIQKIVYQEIENNGDVRGTEIPRDINNLSWSNLIKYYRLDSYRGNITDNLTTPDIDFFTGATLHNMDLTQIEPQSAPMPFITQRSGNLQTALTNSANGVNGNDAVTYDWSIVRIVHNDVSFDSRQKHLGLFVNEIDTNSNPIEYHVTNDSELNVSWYLKLDGFIDLEGESQLVQCDDSILEPTSIGKIECDQQGTADTFTYNYWSSPVKIQNSTSDNFRIRDVMRDGSEPDNPVDINFSSSGYNGSATTPIKIADYWIWKYANFPAGTYSAWQHLRRTGTILPGEGYTMKGPGTGGIGEHQNYVFEGLPNNGDINLTLATDSDYLVGNPYPSAIDADQFIKDNGPELGYDNRPLAGSTPLISGTLYFWEHWGGGSHMLQDYQGGYSTYNLSGAVKAAYKSSLNPNDAADGFLTKRPGRYIPVGQGFFVTGNDSGVINFNNRQRVFKRENSSSVFMRNSVNPTSENSEDSEDQPLEEDLRMKFRIGFKSVNTIRRQLLLTIDENTTPDVDWAYDGEINENQIDDMYWLINDDAYIIQASNEAEISTVYPLGLKSDSDGTNTIMLEALEHVPDDLNVYLHDIDLDLYHDLRASNYDIFLNAGQYHNRFEITFGTSEDILGIEDQTSNSIDVLYSNSLEKIVVVNPNQVDLKSMTLFNMLGQSVYRIDKLEQRNYSEYKIHNLSAGTYIIKLQTATDAAISKKIMLPIKL